jgi:hypothetical protein
LSEQHDSAADPLPEIKALTEAAFAEPTTGEQREAWMRWLHRTREVMPWLIGECERLRAEVVDLKITLATASPGAYFSRYGERPDL